MPNHQLSIPSAAQHDLRDSITLFLESRQWERYKKLFSPGSYQYFKEFRTGPGNTIHVITFDNVIAFGSFTHDSTVKEDVMDKEDNGVMDDDKGKNDEDIVNDNVITFGASTHDSAMKEWIYVLGYRKTNRSFLVKLLVSMTESLMHAKDCYNRVLGKILMDFSQFVLDRQWAFLLNGRNLFRVGIQGIVTG